MKNHKQRINNIIGQLQGVDRMIDGKKDCLAILTQMKAIKSAISALSYKFIEEEFNSCVTRQPKDKNAQLKKIFKELVK